MLFTFIIGQCFTTMLCTMRYGVFLFFAGSDRPISYSLINEQTAQIVLAFHLTL